MDKVTLVDMTDPISGDVNTYAIIDHGNDQFTSMTKAFYDEQQAALSTPIVPE
jgi:hypothetical protein